MKKENKNNPVTHETGKPVMTRKQALKKAGIVSLTAASMMLLLKTPAKAGSSMPAPPPEW